MKITPFWDISQKFKEASVVLISSIIREMIWLNSVRLNQGTFNKIGILKCYYNYQQHFQKLVFALLVHKSRYFYSTLRFITVIKGTSPQDHSDQLEFIPHPVSLRSILNLPSHLPCGTTSGALHLYLGYPIKMFNDFRVSAEVLVDFLSIFHVLITQIKISQRIQITIFLIKQFSPVPILIICGFLKDAGKLPGAQSQTIG